MSKRKYENLVSMLRMLANQGTYEILLYVKDHEGLHYNDIMKYATNNHIVGSRSSITVILNFLIDHHLLDKYIETRPIRTCYRINEKGCKMIKYLNDIKKII